MRNKLNFIGIFFFGTKIPKNLFSKNVCFKHLAELRKKDKMVRAIAADINFGNVNTRLLSFPMKNNVLVSDYQDIEIDDSDEYVILFCILNKPAIIHFGKRGILPSLKNPDPKELLNSSLEIDGNQIGMLNIKHHIPFQILGKSSDLVVYPINSELKLIPNYYDLIKQYKLETIKEFRNKNEARKFSSQMEFEILNGEKVEDFYEEITTNFVKPTNSLPDSTTGIIFTEARKRSNVATTDMHYYPGSRSLLVITTEKPSGAILNFCGVKQDPSQSIDTQVKLEFNPNSLIQLSFPAYVHLFGDFVAISYHPKEGKRFIEVIENDKLKGKGFLESNTIISKTKYPNKIIDAFYAKPVDNSTKYRSN